MKKIIAVTIALLSMAAVSYAITLHVPGEYQTIQGAVDAANHGDTVLVAAGTYEESVIIEDAAICLMSEDGARVTRIMVMGSSNDHVVAVHNSSEISGFYLYRAASYWSGASLKVYDGSPYVHHNLIVCNSEGACCVEIAGSGTPLFLNNSLDCPVTPDATYAWGFHISSADAVPTMKNNIVRAPDWGWDPGYCIYNQAYADLNHTYNDYYIGTLYGTQLGLGEIQENPLWGGVWPSYDLTSNSPCIDAGIPTLLDPDSTRSDMGCFYYHQITYPPTITSTPDTMGFAGLPYSYQLVFDANPFPEFELLTYPAGMTVDTAGLIEWNIPVTAVYDTVVSVRAYNIFGEDLQEYPLHVLENTNHPPEITTYSPLVLDSLDYRDEVEFSITAIDPDLDPLTYSWELNGEEISTDTSCTISFSVLGNNELTARVSDPWESDSVSWQPFVRGTAVSGNVSGTWISAASPYVASSDITIPTGATLVMAPGTVLYLGDSTHLIVQGHLEVVGVEADSVYILKDGMASSGGVRHVQSATSSSLISYCRIEAGSWCVSADNVGAQSIAVYNSHLQAAYGIHTANVENIEARDCRIIALNTGVYSYSINIVTVVDCEFSIGKGVYINGAYNVQVINNVFDVNNIAISVHGGSSICLIEGNEIHTSYYIGIEAWGCLQDILLTRNMLYVVGTPAWDSYAFHIVDSDVEILNNTVVLEYPGRVVTIGSTYGSVNVRNNIMYGAGGGPAIYAYAVSPNSVIEYNDFFGFDSLYYHVSPGEGNVTEDPLFVGGDPYSYELQAGSPCIDAGDPTSPPDPDYTRADMGAYYFNQGFAPSLEVNLTPYNPPVQVPASGGNIDFNIEAGNTGSSLATFSIWCDITLPNGNSYGPVLGPLSVTMNAGWSADRDRIQQIPAIAPAGVYSYSAYVGIYPDIVADMDSFDFEKLTTGDGPVVIGWLNSGGDFDLWMVGTPDLIPAEFSLETAYPNPFNPTTILNLQLPEAADVKLHVYNIRGSLVAVLINGWRDAGSHEVVFDGSTLSSGIYIYRLQAGEHHEVGRMVLMK